MQPLPRLLLAVACCLGAVLPALAQPKPYAYHALTVADGLPENTVGEIEQDHLGFLWVGTHNGLARYDGTSFTVFKANPKDPHSLSDRQVYALMEDATGDLWVGTAAGGLNHWDRATGHFRAFRHNPNDPHSLSHDFVNDLLENEDGTLWVATDGGLDHFDPKTETFTRYPPPRDSTDVDFAVVVMNVVSVGDGTLWVGTHGGGLHRFDTVAREYIARYRHAPDDPHSLSYDHIIDLHQDRLGSLWIATSGGGLNRFDPDTEQFTAFRAERGNPKSLSHDNVYVLEEDESGHLWVGTMGHGSESGLTRLDLREGTLAQVPMDLLAENGIPSNRVLALYADPTGLLWVGTYGAGLARLDPRPPRFPRHESDPGDPDGLQGHEAFSLYESRDGALWLATWDGPLNRYDPETDTYTYIPIDPANPRGLAAMATVMAEDATGTLWIGTMKGLHRRDPRTGRFRRYQYASGDTTTVNHDRISALLPNPDGSMWVGTAYGLSYYDPATDRFTQYHRNRAAAGPSNMQGMADQHIAGLVRAADGRLFVRTDWGSLLIFDPATGTFSPASFWKEGWHVMHLARDAEGHLWLGTHFNGVVRYNLETGARWVFNQRYGLPHDSVLGLLVDDSGKVWVATARGLTCLSPTEEPEAMPPYRTFELTDYRERRPFQAVSAHRGHSGRLYLGGMDGFIAFDPAEIRDDPYPPSIALTDFKLFTTSVPIDPAGVLAQDISVTEEIRLAHWQNDLSFDFIAPSFRFPERTQYAFRLENYDQDWRYAGTRGTATYTNLAPGTYVFRASAANGDDVWNRKAASVRLVIAPPWWRTGWAYSGYVLCFGLGLYGFVRWRTRYLAQRNADLERLVTDRTAEVVQQKEAVEQAKTLIEEQATRLQTMDRLKSRFFANISHEFRTPLALIRGPVQDALEGIHGPLPGTLAQQLPVMQRSSDRLLDLINQLLDLSKLESGNMTLEPSDEAVLPFLKGIVRSFQSLTDRKGLALTFTSDLPETLRAPLDADKLEKIITNLVGNAIKFTPAGGRVAVEATRLGRDLHLRVADTGAGIPAAALPHIFDRFRQADDSATREHDGSGLGLALCKELVELHSGTIEVASTVGTGTVFVVTLPVFGESESRGTGEPGIEVWEREKTDAAGDGLAAEEALAGDGLVPLEAVELAPSPSRGTPEVRATNPKSEIQDAAKPPHELKPQSPTILVVEDHPDVCAYLTQRLSDHYRVETARDGVEGLARARALRPDLILSDVMMPKMDGYTLCRRLKADPDLDHIPVVLLTARASEESKVEGLETGADDYIYKPFSVTELLTRIENLIEIRRLLRHRFGQAVVAVAATEADVSSADAAFLEQVQAAAEAHLADTQFSAEWLADLVGLSPRQLRRKLKALTNLTTAGYLRTLRLQRAMQLLRAQSGTVAEVAYAVGFNDAKYFAKLFRQVYGVPPSQVEPEEAA